MSRGRILAIAIAVLLAELPISFHVFAQEDAIDKRKAIMKTNNADVKAIGKAAEDKDYATIELKAKEIMTGLERVTTFFPPGSTSEKSRAHPDIWVKFDDFKNHASAAANS
jgi:cytochrome c556